MLAVLLALALASALLAGPGRVRSLPREILAATAAFCALAGLSAFWSVSLRLTAGRTLTLGLLLLAAAALAVGTRGRTVQVGRLLLGLLAGAALVAAGGALALLLGDDRATVPATVATPSRYNGLGGNPNTMALLLAVTLPIAAWALLAARTRRGKALAAAVLVLLDVSIVASGSRGAIVASFAGLLPLALVVPRRRLVLAAAAAALLVANIAATQLPRTADRDPVLNPEFGTVAPLAPGDAQFILPLESEIGFERSRQGFRRGLLETSGRTQAWRGAAGQIAERPLLGYGFGTEERVFADRFYLFLADRVENSYIGTALQLGVVGLAALLALLGAFALAAARALGARDGERRAVAAACAGVAAAAAVLAFTQSFLTSVGSPATAPAWIAAFLLAALSVRRPEERRELE
jgi:O-antigen ligase